MFFKLDIILAVAALTLVSPISAVSPVVDLGYASYRGRIVGDGTTQWLGMRYAAPPVGQLRFAAPQNPPRTKKVQDASKFGNICLAQDPNDWTNIPNPRFTLGEDCLFVNVFASSKTTHRSNLPVMFFIQGGGFASNSNANFNGSDLAREENIIVVSINYRVGAYGFLHDEEVRKDGSLNNGIKDQIKALEWVRDNIRKFGGNPSHVVLNGDSAGATSIILLLTAPPLLNTPLFVGAILESTAPVIPLRTLAQGHEQYACLLAATNCTSLPCLRALPALTLQTPLCAFAPSLDAHLIPRPTLLSFNTTSYTRIPLLLGTTTDEGTMFVPPSLATLPSAQSFLSLVLGPLGPLPPQTLSLLSETYLLPPYPTFPSAGPLWRPTSNAVGDLGFHCLALLYARALARDKVPAWAYHYAVRDPALEASGRGVYHTVELHAVWGPRNADGEPPESYLEGGANERVVGIVRGYWGGFVRDLEPNAGRLVGSAVWEGVGGGGRLRIGGTVGETGMEGWGVVGGRCGVFEDVVWGLEGRG